MSWWNRRHHPPQPVATARFHGGRGMAAAGASRRSHAAGWNRLEHGSPALALLRRPPRDNPERRCLPRPDRGQELRPRRSWSASFIPISSTTTFTSQGGMISSWVPPKYRDLIHKNTLVDLVPPGRRVMKLWVSTPHFDYDFSNVPFRVEAPAAFDSSITFVAQDSSGIACGERISVGDPFADHRHGAANQRAARAGTDPVPLRLGLRAAP